MLKFLKRILKKSKARRAELAAMLFHKPLKPEQLKTILLNQKKKVVLVALPKNGADYE